MALRRAVLSTRDTDMISVKLPPLASVVGSPTTVFALSHLPWQLTVEKMSGKFAL